MSGRRGARLAFAACLSLAALALTAALAIGLYDNLAGGELSARGIVLLAAAVLGGGALWIAFTLLDRHFRDLEHLRGDLIAYAAAGRRLDPAWLCARDAGVELQRLAGTISDILGGARHSAERAEQRLEAVVGGAAEALIVVTDSGLVSLVNAAACAIFDLSKIAVGTSVYAGLQREPLIHAGSEAREAGHAVACTLRHADGAPFEAYVTSLGGDLGLVISVPGAGLQATDGVLRHDLTLHDRLPAAEGVEEETPLDALPAVVLDSETTGLDVGRDRIISLAALRMQGMRIYPQENLDILINPGIAIPVLSTGIHGIDDTMVAAAPDIRQQAPLLAELAEGCAVVGHNIGFDLAILRAEARRHGFAWQDPPQLCTALLASALHPEMLSVDLDEVARRYGVEISGRHTALGDALVAAEIFARMIPLLADRGIVTFGAARAFAASAKTLLRQQCEAGWHSGAGERT